MSDRIERIARMMNAIIDREERYEAFLQASPWGILVVDTEYNIAFVNGRLLAMSGYKEEELLGKHMHILLPKRDRKVHKEHEVAYREDPHERHGSYPLDPRLLTKDGQEIPVEISLAPAPVRGKMHYFASLRRKDTLPPRDE